MGVVTINRACLLGNLARDAESRSFQNGGGMVNLRIVTSERWKDRNTGEWKERAEYHSVAVFGDKLVEKAGPLRKGARVYAEGQLQTRKWTDSQGQDRYSTEIVLQGPASVLEACEATSRADHPNSARAPETAGAGGWGDASDLDDDVPF